MFILELSKSNFLATFVLSFQALKKLTLFNFSVTTRDFHTLESVGKTLGIGIYILGYFKGFEVIVLVLASPKVERS